MRLDPYPELGRYHKGKGRPSVALIPRGQCTLPPLVAIGMAQATINPNGDPATSVVERARAQITEIAAELAQATTAAERRRLGDLILMFERLIAAMRVA